MATKKEVESFIRKTFEHEEIEKNVFKFLVTTKLGRSQMVFARVHEEVLQVTSPVAWQSSVNADQILDLNSSMFGIVKVNGAYGLKHNAFIEDIDESEIESALTVLGIYADDLEIALGLEDEF